MVALDLSQVAKGLPTKPGVYLFKDGRGTVVYVGKAASLRSRVRSYFATEGDLKAQQIEAALPLTLTVLRSGKSKRMTQRTSSE